MELKNRAFDHPGPLHSSIKEFEKKHDIEGLSFDYIYPNNMTKEQYAKFVIDEIHLPLFVNYRNASRDHKDEYIDAILRLKRTNEALFELNPELDGIDRNENPFVKLGDDEIIKLIETELEKFYEVKDLHKPEYGVLPALCGNSAQRTLIETSPDLATLAYLSKQLMSELDIALGVLFHFPPCDIKWCINSSSEEKDKLKVFQKQILRKLDHDKEQCTWAVSPETLDKINKIADEREREKPLRTRITNRLHKFMYGSTGYGTA